MAKRPRQCIICGSGEETEERVMGYTVRWKLSLGRLAVTWRRKGPHHLDCYLLGEPLDSAID